MILKFLILDVVAVPVVLVSYMLSTVTDDWLPIMALTAAFMSPLLLAWLNARTVQANKKADWDREDEVARRAAEAALALVAGQRVQIETAVETVSLVKEGISITSGLAESSAAASVKQGEQLTEIHTLVNSNMTTALSNELTSYRALLVLLREDVIRLEEKDKNSLLYTEAVSSVQTTLKKIKELEEQIKNRESGTE